MKRGRPLRRTGTLKRNRGTTRRARMLRGEIPGRFGPRPSGKMLRCESCRVEFYATANEISNGRRFCSQTCMGDAARIPRTCTVCGGAFSNANRKVKTCSKPCANQAKSAGKIGERNPNYRHGRSRRTAQWTAARAACCQRCGTNRGRRVQHHVVYRQHVIRAGGDEWDPLNALTLCQVCHDQHHALDRLATSQLTVESIDFAFALLGPAALDYFMRHYVVDTPDDLCARAGIPRDVFDLIPKWT